MQRSAIFLLNAVLTMYYFSSIFTEMYNFVLRVTRSIVRVSVMTTSCQSDYGQEGREVKGKLLLASVLKYRSPQLNLSCISVPQA